MPFAWLLIASALQTPTFSAVRQHTYDLEYSSVGVGYMTRGSLFVGLMDDATVVELRTNGERRNWGRRGTGPGEFRSPHLVGVLADTLWVADYSAARITVLGTDTTVYPLLTTDLIGGTRAYLGAGVTVAAGMTAADYRVVSSQAGVIATGTKPDIASVVLGATEMEGMLRMQSPYSKGMLVGYDLPRRMVVVLERGEDSYSVAWYDALTGTRVHAVSYTRARERTPRGLTDAIARMHYERTKDVLKQFTQADYLKAFRRDLKEPRYLPAVSDMVVASTGEVWVAGAMSVPGRPIRWTLMNPDGGIKGAVELPAMTTVYAAEGDVVVLEHDTSQLVLYRLTGPTR